ncbi:MAG: 50S ribosomal protein L24 [Nanoarchaeota archaeon]|nr:50S ribosomal protein L24 [Nanoarchaeota archaeon]
MKKEFSSEWKSSKKPSKQRKYRAKAPLHLKTEFLSSHLSKDLKKKYGRRNVTIRKNDKVKILRGQFKGKVGKIERVDRKNEKIYIAGVEMTKKDGGKSFYPIHPSNLLITELHLEDRKRIKSLERK